MVDDISDCVPSCSFLKTPIKISELMKNGIHFDASENFNRDDEDFLVDEDLEVEMGRIVSPWTKPFDELKKDMIKVNEFLWKKIITKGNEEQGLVPNNARVYITYNAHWEFEGVPFDSSQLRKSIYGFYTGRGEVLSGIEQAVRTMCAGEEAWFVISYQLLFGPLGCPPRIKPKADGLYVITVKSFNEVGNLAADKDLSEEERRNFATVIEKVKQIHKKGLDFFQQKQYDNAAQCFEHAASVLMYCHIKEANEYAGQSEWLVKLHTNLVICNNKLNKPETSCQHVCEIRRLTGNKVPCKVLLHEGRALVKLGEYEKARKVLVQAQYMQPQDKIIADEIRELAKMHRAYKESQKNLWTKAFGLKENCTEPAATATITNNSNEEDELTNIWEEELLAFKNDKDVKEITLDLPKNQKSIIEDIVKRIELKLRISPLNEGSYIVSKK